MLRLYWKLKTWHCKKLKLIFTAVRFWIQTYSFWIIHVCPNTAAVRFWIQNSSLKIDDCLIRAERFFKKTSSVKVVTKSTFAKVRFWTKTSSLKIDTVSPFAKLSFLKHTSNLKIINSSQFASEIWRAHTPSFWIDPVCPNAAAVRFRIQNSSFKISKDP